MREGEFEKTTLWVTLKFSFSHFIYTPCRVRIRLSKFLKVLWLVSFGFLQNPKPT